jgi:hypothetical protein
MITYVIENYHGIIDYSTKLSNAKAIAQKYYDSVDDYYMVCDIYITKLVGSVYGEGVKVSYYLKYDGKKFSKIKTI